MSVTKARKKDQLVGKRLGDYKLTELLATGGMARIYRAEDINLGRKAAVKVLLQDQPDPDQSLTKRFEREAKAIAGLDHENIIPIYQFRQEDGMYFLAMKFIDGHDLASELGMLHSTKTLMEVPRAMHILGQVAGALDHAHKANVVHRDVKPSNILLTENDKAILTDFGLVLAESVEKTLGTAFGTPRYIAPEQAIASEKAVPQSDIYALAIVAYEMLTGQTPFNGETPMEIALAHVSDPPPPPRSINPDVPEVVEKELLRALDKDPTKRHATAIEFVNALKTGYNIPLNAIYVPTAPAVAAVGAANSPNPLGLITSSNTPSTAPAPAPARGRGGRNAQQAAAPVIPSPISAAPPAPAPEKARGRGLLGGGRGNAKADAKKAAPAAPLEKPAKDVNRTPAFAPGVMSAAKAPAADPTLPPHSRSVAKTRNKIKKQKQSRLRRLLRLPLLIFSTIVLFAAGMFAVGISGRNGSAQQENNNGISGVAATADSSQPVPTVGAAGTPAGSIEVQLIYDQDSIFILNSSSSDLMLDGLRFVRDGSIYAVGTQLRIPGRTLPAGTCIRINRSDRTPSGTPNGCRALHADISLPFDSLFWFTSSSEDTFEVQRSSRVLERCAAVRRGGSSQCSFLWTAAETGG